MSQHAQLTKLAALLVAVLGTAVQPSAQPVSDVEITADGLHRIDPAVMPNAWINTESDITQYARAFVMPTVVMYRDLRPPSHSSWADMNRSAFPLSEHMQKRLQESFGESFHEMMDGQRVFEVADALGRDVVLVRGYLTDVATGMPLDLAGSDVDVVRWAWEANLIIELRDSMTDDVLFRAADRQRIEGPLDPDTLFGLAPQVTRRWSRIMVDRLQELSTFYPSRLYRLQERARAAEDLD